MQNIRNFCIIAHIDHGKSTLADRFLELTGTVAKSKMREQYLDQMELERERGITIKMQPVRMMWNGVVLNLIDTPGHIDFSYEVSRALVAVEGAILLVDATQGVQAQTLTNLHLAREQGLTIIPVINKIDLEAARVEEAREEIVNLLDVDFDEILEISAKNGEGVRELLDTVVRRVPSPRGGRIDAPLRALVFDSLFDTYKGVIAYVRLFDGGIRKGEALELLNQHIEAEALETGIFKPELFPIEKLSAGEIGYIATGIKEAEKVRVGETVTAFKIQDSPNHPDVSGGTGQARFKIHPLPGYKEPKPMVFASFYTERGEDYELLKEALKKLKLQDASLSFEDEFSPALGRGFRCGFLGMLHMEIISERLKREFGLSLVITTPTVLYKVRRESDGTEFIVRSPAELPDEEKIAVFEPWVKLEILSPQRFLGAVQELLRTMRGEFGDIQYLGKDKILIAHFAPLAEVIKGFFDHLKSVTSGYASLNYELLFEFRQSDLGKLTVLLAGKPVEAFTRIVARASAHEEGKRIVEKLKEVLPPQQFALSIQAAFGGKIIAREDKKALRKDVIAGLYGGDYTRKRKLLEKQKKGKKKMKAIGEITIPQDVFLNVLKG